MSLIQMILTRVVLTRFSITVLTMARTIIYLTFSTKQVPLNFIKNHKKLYYTFLNIFALVKICKME